MIHDARHTFGGNLEDFKPGDVYKHWPGKTITEADNHYEVKPFFVGTWGTIASKTAFTGVTKGTTTTYTFSADPTTKFKVGQTVTVSDAGTGYNANQIISDTTSTTIVTDLDSGC